MCPRHAQELEATAQRVAAHRKARSALSAAIRILPDADQACLLHRLSAHAPDAGVRQGDAADRCAAILLGIARG